MRRRNRQQATPLRNSLELVERNSHAKFLMSAPKPKQREKQSLAGFTVKVGYGPQADIIRLPHRRGRAPPVEC